MAHINCVMFYRFGRMVGSFRDRRLYRFLEILLKNAIIMSKKHKKPKKSRKKTTKIPIYGGQITVVYVEKLSTIEHKYNLASTKGFNAVYFKKKHTHYIALSTKRPDIIAHEALHFVGEVLEGCGIYFDIKNDEAYCYLLGWAVRTINKAIK